MPTKPGRPQLHPDAAKQRRLALVATNDEWETILAGLPVDSRKRALYILRAVTGVTTQEDSDE